MYVVHSVDVSWIFVGRYKILRAHILPLTNCAFNKSGDKFITGSYDRTCKVWNTATGDELLTLEGVSDSGDCCLLVGFLGAACPSQLHLVNLILCLF